MTIAYVIPDIFAQVFGTRATEYSDPQFPKPTMTRLPVLDSYNATAASSERALTESGHTRRQLVKSALFTLVLSGLPTLGAGCSSSERNTDSTSETSEFELSGRPKSELGPDSRLPFIWIEAGVCTGCAVTLLGSLEPTIEAVLPLLRLEFQETLMDRSGPSEIDRLLAVSAELSGKYLLIVDGTIPMGPSALATMLGVASDGYELTAQDLITHLSQRAAAIVALGTCASFGGLTAAAPNPADHRPVPDAVPPGIPLDEHDVERRRNNGLTRYGTRHLYGRLPLGLWRGLTQLAKRTLRTVTHEGLARGLGE